MILSFNPEIFTSNEAGILKKLAQILDIITTDRKLIDLIDIKGFYSTVFDAEGKYIFDEGRFSAEHLSEFDRINLKDVFSSLAQKGDYTGGLRRKYLTTLRIGLGENEIHPELAYRVLSIPSRIIVENATNDWKFIEGIVAKYRNHNKRRSIYMLISQALNTSFMLAEHAGGKTQIKPRFEDLEAHQYKDIYQFKLMALFDSDRNNDSSLQNEANILINFLKNKPVNVTSAFYEDSDLIVWHMFYKRELENYVPINILVGSVELTREESIDLTAKNHDELNFLDYERYLENNPNNINIKRDFPEIFLIDWTREHIEKRCEPFRDNIELPNGTLEDVSEIEKILLKIAKII